jgi:hypothetical protein
MNERFGKSAYFIIPPKGDGELWGVRIAAASFGLNMSAALVFEPK